MSSSRKISFSFDMEKFVNVVAYFASKIEGLDKLKAAKLLYLADRHHLIKYARPIVGDRYYKAPYGPVPHIALNIINDTIINDIKTYWTDLVKQYIKIDKIPEHPVLRGKKSADLDIFSESELEIIYFVINKYGEKSGVQLINLTHKQAAWVKSREGEEIDYRLFFEENPEAKDVLELMELEQENRDLIKELRD